MGLGSKILWWFLIDFHCRYVKEEFSPYPNKDTLYYESWYQWLGFKFNKVKFVIAYETRK